MDQKYSGGLAGAANHEVKPIASTSGSNDGRLLELDSMRGLAALAVAIFHYTSRYEAVWGHSQGFWPRFSIGQYGVDVFFVISGFVICMTLSRSKTGADFVVNRFARLYPVYWAAVTFSCLVTAFGGLPALAVGWRDWLWNLTMWQSLASAALSNQDFQIRMVDGVYWTLQRELFFYCMMLSLFLVDRLKRVEICMALWLGLRLLYLAWPGGLMKKLGFLLNLDYADLFAAGVIFYQIREGGFTRLRLVILLAALLSRFIGSPLAQAVVALGAFIFFLLMIKDRTAWLRHPSLVLMGMISYSFYLIHQNLGYAIIHAGYQAGGSPWIWVPGSLLCSILIAIGLTFLIERPANRYLRTRWKQAGSRSAAQWRPG